MGQRYELSSFIDRILSDTHDFGFLGSRTVQYYKLKKLLNLVGISDKLRSLKHKVNITEGASAQFLKLVSFNVPQLLIWRLCHSPIFSMLL